MLGSVFAKTLWERRRGLLWWSVGVAALVGVTVVFYPSVRSSASGFQEMMDQLPEALRSLFIGNITDLASPVGYLNSQIFATNGPILLLVFSIGAGSRSLAGEEERHTLDLLLSMPITRRAVVLQKFAALCVELLVLGIILWATTALAGRPVDLVVPAVDLAAAVVHILLFVLGIGTIALAIGCWTGRRAVAIGVASAIAVASFLLNSLAPLSDATEPLQKASPMYQATGTTPLLNGFDPTGILVLAAVTVVALTLAVRTFDRRDLRV